MKKVLTIFILLQLIVGCATNQKQSINNNSPILIGTWQGDSEKSYSWHNKHLAAKINGSRAYKNLNSFFITFNKDGTACRVFTSGTIENDNLINEVDWLYKYNIIESNEDGILIHLSNDELSIYSMFIFDNQDSYYFVQLKKDTPEREGSREFYRRVSLNKSKHSDAINCAGV